MKSKLNCFLQVVNAELTIEETNHNKIKTLVEETFEIPVSQEDHNLYFYSILLKREMELCKNEFYNEKGDNKCNDKIREFVNSKHLYLDNLKEMILLKTGDRERGKLFDFTQPVTADSFYKLIYVCIDQFQLYLEKKFWDLLEIENKVSDHYHNETLNELFDQVQKVICHLRDNKIDDELIIMFIYPTECFLKLKENQRSTVHNFSYYEKFISIFNELIEEKRDERLKNIDVIKTLFITNYNTPRFYAYSEKFIKRDLMNTASFSEKVNKIYDYLKEAQCTPMRVKYAFFAGRECIKSLIVEYCTTELKLFKKFGKLNADLPLDNEGEPADEILSEKEKLLWFGNAPGLSHFVKGMKEAGLITNKDLTETCRGAAKTFRTKNQGEVSAKRLRKNSYKPNINEETRKELLEKIEALKAYINNLE